MRNYFSLLLVLVLSFSSFAQVGIGNTDPDPSSLLDIRDNQGDKGVLVNHVALTNASLAAPIRNPADGLLVFNTNENLSPRGYENDVRKGFYYWDADQSRWIPQKTEDRSARFTSDNVTFNLNGSVDELPIYGFVEWNDDNTLYDLFNDQTDLRIGEDGRYHIIVNVPITTSGARTNIDAEIKVTRGGTNLFPGATSSANYIRNNNSHNNSTIFIDEIIVLQAGDDVSINVSGETNVTADVNIRSIGAANLSIIKIK